jgi:hypothetical protein
MANLSSIVGQKVTNLDITEKCVNVYTESGAVLAVNAAVDGDDVVAQVTE